ncbi:hypothetical protein B0H16DRAFT_1692543 [Mycena metata]|uniref:Uncharacterized protein n=1 Tax=Mycena metata TaxID=1033252 RepID=A0AAD7IN68_9AGAR|nr:hypothetical protein B0H16DRAFT_1692543 [Mycena metata]
MTPPKRLDGRLIECSAAVEPRGDQSSAIKDGPIAVCWCLSRSLIPLLRAILHGHERGISPALYADHQKKSKHASTIHQKLPVCLRLLAKQRGDSDRGVQSSLTPHPTVASETLRGFGSVRGRVESETSSAGCRKGRGEGREAEAGVERRRLVSKAGVEMKVENWCRKGKCRGPRAEGTTGWRKRRSKRLEGGENYEDQK